MYTIKKGGMIMKLSNMRMSGFTLAEVLITLGIIGVVAAMTMPTLMNSTQGAQYKAAYKKALSAISQGVTLNVALDGSSFADAVASAAAGSDAIDTENSIAGILNARMNIVNAAGSRPADITVTNTSGVDLPEDLNTYLYFNDGSMFALTSTDTLCTLEAAGGATVNVCEGYIDVNGDKGPNKVVQCDGGTGATATAKDSFDTAGNKTEATACNVGNPTDIYPVFFYDQTITPATNAAKAVLYGK